MIENVRGSKASSYAYTKAYFDSFKELQVIPVLLSVHDIPTIVQEQMPSPLYIVALKSDVSMGQS